MRAIPSSSAARKRMQATRQRGTSLEQQVRRLLWSNGLRGYRVNVRHLPGSPDVVFTRWKVAVFAHGCYWHGCTKCNRSSPKANAEFWRQKFEDNRKRDARVQELLKDLGFDIIVIWECELRETAPLLATIRDRLVAAGRRTW